MSVDAILFDIDGTLVLHEKAISGAVEAVSYARAQGIEVRFLTNMTGRSPAQIATALTDLGIEADSSEVQTATSACVSLLKAHPRWRCHLMIPNRITDMFDGIVRDDISPDVVVIGDLDDAFDFAAMNRAFLMLRNGAELIVFHKNLFWLDATGARLDSGAFVVALEAASGKSATVTGKPSRLFFETALSELRCSRDRVLIIGDDVKTDITGGRTVGVRTVLVGTGKYDGRPSDSAHREDFFLDSIGRLPELLSTMSGVR